MCWFYDEEDEQTAEQGEDYLDICTNLPFSLRKNRDAAGKWPSQKRLKKGLSFIKPVREQFCFLS